MSNKEGHWTLDIQVNRKIGEKTYTSLRLYVPSSDGSLLLKRLQSEEAKKQNYTSTPSFTGQRSGSRQCKFKLKRQLPVSTWHSEQMK